MKKKWSFDDDGFCYVLHNQKKIYMGLLEYVGLEAEQNINSPHRYFTEKFKVNEGECFVDVGAAEGLISLDVIEKASEIYLIECDEEWIKKLNKTFEPWQEKIHIIPKFASDICDKDNITLDSLLKNTTSPIMIKMDVEGMEKKVLSGAKEILSRNNVKFAVCTYHRANDKEELQNFFEKHNYNFEFTKGYLLMREAPYFRTGIIRAWK